MFMSGTPLFKTPVDLWTMCEACDPSGLGKNFWNFVHRYCDAREDGYGLDTSGASNSEELQFLMRSRFMIRREKTDVAAEIPSNRQTIVLPQTGLERLVQREQSIVRRNLSNFEAMLNSGLTGGTVDEIVANFSQFDGIDRSETEEACPTCDGRGSPGEDVPCSQCGGTGAIERAVSARVLQYVEQAAELSTVRRELALQKVPMCVRWLEDLLTNEDKVVVFAHHRDVVAKLREAFPEAAVLIGGMTAKQKWEAIDRFNNDPACRVFIGNLVAAGQIINLSIADVVAFVEVSWVPSEMDQCEERIWDVEKVRPVSIYRLVVEGSLDERMCAVLEIRQKVIDRTMKVKALHAA
jgi:SWI/SNF-related matrix-associated actin-dependent regulator 1 of chromatin subfamily A